MKRKENNKTYHSSSKVILIFSSMVFFVLLATICVVGFIMYLIFQRDTLNITSVETASTLIFLSLVASIIIGTIIAAITARVVLSNIDNIVDGMRDLAHGKYDVRVPEIEKGISKELISSFNMLAAELENTQTLRADFVNDFAHEFKTPIVSLLGFAKLLKNPELTEEERNEYVRIIEEEAERLSSLSTNSLNFTRVDKQTILTGETDFNLSEQIRNCVLLLEKKWTSKNLELNLELDETFIRANEEMLKQVWINLIDNAIKFSFSNTELKIRLVKSSTDVLFCIKNHGAVIPEGDKEKIFTRFYRSGNSCGIEGTGVGLAIVKKIVDLHKGKIDVVSVDDTTEFKLSLPRKRG